MKVHDFLSTNRNQIYCVDCLGTGRFGGEGSLFSRGVEIDFFETCVISRY